MFVTCFRVLFTIKHRNGIFFCVHFFLLHLLFFFCFTLWNTASFFFSFTIFGLTPLLLLHSFARPSFHFSFQMLLLCPHFLLCFPVLSRRRRAATPSRCRLLSAKWTLAAAAQPPIDALRVERVTAAGQRAHHLTNGVPTEANGAAFACLHPFIKVRLLHHHSGREMLWIRHCLVPLRLSEERRRRVLGHSVVEAPVSAAACCHQRRANAGIDRPRRRWNHEGGTEARARRVVRRQRSIQGVQLLRLNHLRVRRLRPRLVAQRVRRVRRNALEYQPPAAAPAAASARRVVAVASPAVRGQQGRSRHLRQRRAQHAAVAPQPAFVRRLRRSEAADAEAATEPAPQRPLWHPTRRAVR
eukprot:Rhum_TRINITY_DN14863_c0_g2::Rhum_TRINITY_DN14863_c0_g2_i1::g.123617::m.123617